MSLDLDADLDAIVGDDLFGTCGELADGTCFNGIFTDATDATVVYGVEIEAQDASFAIKSSEASDVATKATITIDETVYIVERKQKVGNGLTLLYLKTKRS